jgi:DNA-binding NarL/FixJ family response regulator
MQTYDEMNDPIRVAVVDNHRLFRDGVITTLNETADFKVIAAGERGSHAVRIAQDYVPEIMLLDLNMPEGGIEAAREISALCPYVKTIVLTSCEGGEHFSEISEAGVRVYIMKGVSATSLVETLRRVHRADEPILDEVCNSCGRKRPVLHREERESRATSTLPPAGSGGQQIGQVECPLRREFAGRKKALLKGGTCKQPATTAHTARS